jgi:hypothetical protein
MEVDEASLYPARRTRKNGAPPVKLVCYAKAWRPTMLLKATEIEIHRRCSAFLNIDEMFQPKCR